MRRVARERVFQLIFEYTFYQTANEGTLSLMTLGANLTDDDKRYIADPYEGVCASYDALKDEVSASLEGYSFDRLFRSDAVALVLATYELKLGKESDAVVINEAVSLAKKFGSEKSGKFVNGVLSKIVKSLREQN